MDVRVRAGEPAGEQVDEEDACPLVQPLPDASKSDAPISTS
jgi:hypothetical protein